MALPLHDLSYQANLAGQKTLSLYYKMTKSCIFCKVSNCDTKNYLSTQVRLNLVKVDFHLFANITSNVHDVTMLELFNRIGTCGGLL
jgi:hypothetical protein